MSDESQLRVMLKDGASSRSLLKGRSDLVARGRRDAAMVAARERTAPLSDKCHLAGEKEDFFKLGLAYWLGLGVPPDHVEAARWFRKAADQGNAFAQFNLGLMYGSGQ